MGQEDKQYYKKVYGKTTIDNSTGK